MIISLMAAMSQNRVIGRDQKLPWHLPQDLKRFNAMTKGHVVGMGRKTFESIGKVLPQRTNIIITRQKNYKVEGGIVVDSLEKALAPYRDTDEEIFILGGGEIFSQTINQADRIYLTEIKKDFDGDSFFPQIDPSQFQIVKKEDHSDPMPFSYLDYARKN